MRGISVFILVCWSVSVFGTGGKDSTAVRYGKTIKSEDLKKHLDILASDTYEGRETGRKGQKMAAEYISNHFKNIGLPEVGDDGYFQHFPLILNDPSQYNITADGQEFKFIEDFYFFNRLNKMEFSSTGIVFAGYGINSENYNDYSGVNVGGNAVMILDGEPKDKKGRTYVDQERSATSWSKSRKKKIKAAQKKGATMVYTVVSNYDLIVKDLKHYLEKPKMELDKPDKEAGNGIPNIFVSEETADRILKGDQSIAKMRKQINKKGVSKSVIREVNITLKSSQIPEKMESENVLGYIKGSDKADELVVITAHYDHIGIRGDQVYNGADDDGSGTVALLEIAEAFAKAKEEGRGPRRSILVMPVSGEEKGLLGSKYYVENPVFSLDATVADLNIDMIGRRDEQHVNNANYVYLIGSDKLSTELHDISEQANDTYTSLDLDYTFNDPDDPNRFYYRSDHYNFARNNIPVIFYFNGVHEDYHRATDTVDKIDFEKIEKISRLVFYTAWDLANREKRITLDVENDFK